jgi:hypothetical protein
VAFISLLSFHAGKVTTTGGQRSVSALLFGRGASSRRLGGEGVLPVDLDWLKPNSLAFDGGNSEKAGEFGAALISKRSDSAGSDFGLPE